MPNEVPNKEIKEVAFGAAFSPRFQLLDLWGEIEAEIEILKNDVEKKHQLGIE